MKEEEIMDGNRPRREYLKSRLPNWKEKLRQNCLKRVREERAHLLWKYRSNLRQPSYKKEIVECSFRSIVSDELQKIKQTALTACQIISASKNSDSIWEYDELCVDNSNKTENEELLLEMERLLYEDLREELIRRELQVYEEEDEYLARAVLDHMQLNVDQVEKNDKVWCPICKQGELCETYHLIYCTRCQMRLDLKDDKVNLNFVRERLGEAHMEHLDQGCKATPKFCLENMFNLTALYIQCEICNTFEIVV